MTLLHPSFKFLGRQCYDIVTKIEGVCDSICFDLYGCIQASLRPDGLNDKGEPKPAYWFDVKRLKMMEAPPVMPCPDFSQPEIGAASKAPR